MCFSKYFVYVTYSLKVCSLLSDQPVLYGGAADVICNAQEIKMRPEKTELSGLMNPCRGAAVGMDYYHKGQTHTRVHKHTQIYAKASLCLPSTALWVKSIKYLQLFKGVFQHNHHNSSWQQSLKINIFLSEGNSLSLFLQIESNTMETESHSSSSKSISIETDYSPGLRVVCVE